MRTAIGMSASVHRIYSVNFIYAPLKHFILFYCITHIRRSYHWLISYHPPCHLLILWQYIYVRNCPRRLTFYALVRLHIIKCQNFNVNAKQDSPTNTAHNSHVKCTFLCSTNREYKRNAYTKLEKRSKSMWETVEHITVQCTSHGSHVQYELVYQFNAIFFVHWKCCWLTIHT